MNAVLPELLMVVGTAVAAVPAAYLASLNRRGRPESRSRALVRLALASLIAIVVGVNLPFAVWSLADDGTWQCLVCAKEERHRSFAGFAYERTPCLPTEFETWFWREIGGEHDHDWTPVGPHRRGFMTGCHGRPGPGRTFFASLPKLPDQELAVSLASRVLGADDSEREAMLLAVSDDPFRSIAYGDAASVQDFDAAYSAWLDRHPEWR